jgi:hypothetical protein
MHKSNQTSTYAHLTDKQSRFCEEYLIDLNATQAAIRSGYSFITTPEGFYVYLLINPLNNSLFYIGKGKGNRALQHLRNFKNGTIDNSAKAEVIQDIINQGKEPLVYYLQDDLTEEQAYQIEKFLISSLKDFITNIAGGVATNIERDSVKAKFLFRKIIPYERWRQIKHRTVQDRLLYFRIKRGLKMRIAVI